MIYNFILLILAILPIIILGSYVYYKDKEKEPKNLLIKLFVGGILAAILTILFSFALKQIFPILSIDNVEYDSFKLLIYSFISVGLIEEICKWIFLYLFAYHNKEFDQLYDMLVYAVFVALGFAIVENILYVYDGGIAVALSRFFLAIPGHVSIGIFMGYYLAFAKLASIKNKEKSKNKFFIFSILIPCILHGIYDYCVLSNNAILLVVFLVFIVILFYQAKKTLLWISKIDAPLNIERKNT